MNDSTFKKTIIDNLWIFYLAFAVTLTTGYDYSNWQFWVICLPTFLLKADYDK